MNLSQEHVTRLGFWATLALSVLAWGPATYPGYWQAQEGFVPIFNAVRGGAIAAVATVPDLWRGMGNGTFLPAQPFLAMGFEPTVAVRIVFGLAFVLGGLGMYIWLGNRLGDRAAGLAALVFMLWPPLLATVYTRGSLADALVVGILPLALAGLTTYVDTRAPSAAGIAVLSLLWIWRIQAGMAVFITLLLLAYVAFVERSRLAALVVGVSSAAGLVSLANLWNVQNPSPVDFYAHFLTLYTLLSAGLTPLFAGAVDVLPAAISPIPPTLGPAVLVLGIAGLWFWWSSRIGWRTTVTARMFAFGWLVTGVAIVLCLPWSQPLWHVSGAARLLTYPWQVLLVAAPFFALAVGGLPALQPVLAQTRFWSVLVVLVVLSSYPYLRADYTQLPAPEQPRARFGQWNEIVILEAVLRKDRAEPAAVLDVTWQVLHTPAFDYNVFFQALTPVDGEFQTVAQLDTQPLAGRAPATTWQPGQIFTDTYRLELPAWPDRLVRLSELDGQLDDEPEDEPGSGPGDEPGDATGDETGEVVDGGESMPPLRFDFGYYDWRDGTRLPVDGGIDDKLMFYGR